MKRLVVFAMAGLLFAGQAAMSDWQIDPGNSSEVKAQNALRKFRERIPRTQAYFDQAHGFAIFPSVTRVGFGLGGAYGKGVVIQGDRTIGASKYWQFTSGIQAGARNFSMIIFFKDEQALKYFQSGDIQFMGQAGLAVATAGIAGTPAYNDGVAIVTMTRFGLMAEFTVSGAKFNYKPLSDE